MALQIFFPYSMVLGTSPTRIANFAPSVDALPAALGAYEVVVLSQDSGGSPAGSYYYSSTVNRWYFMMPYKRIMGSLFEVAEAVLCLPNAGQTLIPVGNTGQAAVTVYRNGVELLTGYTVVPNGILLTNPTFASDFIAVGMVSPIRANTPISGGISDVPNNGKAYVRKFGEWDDTDTITYNEGSF